MKVLPRTDGGATLSHIRLTVNKSQTVKAGAAFADVLVGSSEIADVVPLSDRTIYLLGKKVGTTNVSIISSDKKLVGLIDVEVRPDVDAIASQIHQSTGEPKLTVASQGDRVLLGGVAEDAPTVDRAMQVAPPGTVNLTQVRSPQQVMLKVRFVEVNRNADRELGTRFEFGGSHTLASIGAFGTSSAISSSTNTGGLLSGAVGTAVSAATTGGVPFGTVVQSFTGSGNQLDIFISALESKGLLRRLAEPNLIANSGERAEFLAGGEIPIPIANQTTNGSPQITVSYKEFGVKLAFTPTVLRNSQIHLELEPEVSDIDSTLSVAVGGGVSVPGLSKRRAKTSVDLRDGQSFAIAGLLQTQSTRNIDQLPWLGSIPVLGALFRSSLFQERETELVVIVTPQLVKPVKPSTPLGTPLDTTLPANDVDLFVDGRMEVPRDPRYFATPRGKVIGPYGHILQEPVNTPSVATRSNAVN
ncbi:type II and III secretion system protein family protein [Lichenifustis flavocetrariae]|uniref:Type II and III secretion system protein family protein n=1 Tax=Lichenifustis flavocetrariae TaxID=2949735 RepID=A0AA41Z2T5_9HYPH|nr:type II and III secretion system protein family protein [Lichenifustis flavocetrariae]MCW6511936.1 type II and III secretion system protein family protein [Lichenifustis flavocetrariae]